MVSAVTSSNSGDTFLSRLSVHILTGLHFYFAVTVSGRFVGINKQRNIQLYFYIYFIEHSKKS